MKHYDGKMIRLQRLDEDEIEPDKSKGIQIMYKGLEFTFFPRVVASDETGQPIFAFKFNDGERIALYWRMPNAPKTDEAIQMLINVAKVGGYTPMDIMDYLPEIYETAMKSAKGELPLKDGPHPGWKLDNVKTTYNRRVSNKRHH